MKSHNVIKYCALIIFVISIVSISIYCFRFYENFNNSTTQDFANFGSYINGILTPIATLLSAFFIGFEISNASKSRKLERNVKEFEQCLHLLSLEIATISSSEIEENYNKYSTLFLKSKFEIIFLDSFFKENTKLFNLFELLKDTLYAIEELDANQYKTCKGFIFVSIERDTIGKIEAMDYFLKVSLKNHKIENFKFLIWQVEHSYGDI
ncbi:hypothetical protein CO725_01135 [Vibrio parahaemolyticus]|uniref:hypothetical protein n=1 Tax=Vibrio parahaemolyticus TaxID=670 RepID=UPI000BE225AD|nr:hypothetical protein [Vibrio parahaemolyticus]ATI44291.1 hypothetical protein CO725_01135 [Vibrio parahaemolyticus]